MGQARRPRRIRCTRCRALRPRGAFYYLHKGRRTCRVCSKRDKYTRDGQAEHLAILSEFGALDTDLHRSLGPFWVDVMARARQRARDEVARAA